MALFDEDTEFECIICGETLSTVAEAEAHAKDEHVDDIIEEEWGHYFNEQTE